MNSQNKILAVLVLGVLMGAIDTTIVLLALPTINAALHTNLVLSVWVILAYLLVIAVASTQFGRLGDIYGRGRMFNLGFVVFTVGSLLCGLAPSILFLVAFRIIQGAGGALLQSNSGAIIADTFEPRQRGRAFGYTSLGWSFGAMLGILLGGVLTTFAGWQYIFFINVPIGIVATYYGMRHIKDSRRTDARIDWPGMASLTASLLLIAYGAIDIAGEGIAVLNVALILIGAVILGIFFLVETRSKSPLMDLHIFKNNKVLTRSVLATFFMSLGYLGVVFIIIMYLQGVRGLSPLDASLLLTPGYIVTAIIGPRMGRLSDTHGARIIATIGLALMMVTVTIYLTLTPNSSLYLILIASFISGLGVSMFFPANSSAIMANAQQDQYGSVSGLSRLMQNIGTLSSYVIILTVASLSVSRQTAFEIFLGTSRLIGGVSAEFIKGIDAALVLSIIVLFIAAVLSYSRGRENRGAGHSGPAEQG